LNLINHPDFFQIHGTESENAAVPHHTHQCPDILVLSLYCIIVMSFPAPTAPIKCGAPSAPAFHLLAEAPVLIPPKSR
jgi:hypothetical protein